MTAGAALHPSVAVPERDSRLKPTDRSRPGRHRGRMVTSLVDRLPGITFALRGCPQGNGAAPCCTNSSEGKPSAEGGTESSGALSPTHLTRSRTRTAEADPTASPRPIQGRALTSTQKRSYTINPKAGWQKHRGAPRPAASQLPAHVRSS